MFPIEIQVLDGQGASVGHFQLTTDGHYQIGREGSSVEIPLEDSSVSRRHAALKVIGGRVFVTDEGSTNGTRVAGNVIGQEWHEWRPGSPLSVGDFTLIQGGANPSDSRPGLDPEHERTAYVDVAARNASSNTPQLFDSDFPGPLFAREVIPVAEIRATGKLAGQSDYLAVGGGIGSFAWVDHLRCYGVAESQIRVVGVGAASYEKWKEYCMNSQIPLHERIRSNSVSTPDNIWGFPGYASRETWRELKAGRIGGLKYIFQVFGEPTVAETYTPRSMDVHKSLDQEQARIGWFRMYSFGRAISLRKTDDGRYVLAYKIPVDRSDGGDRDRFWIARFVHIATGYPTTRYLEDLQAFKRQNRGSERVVNAYEKHEDIYRALESRGGTVVVRGRGIVASRVLQRLWEARHKNTHISILHLLRNPVQKGNSFEWASRPVRYDVEMQPFNWPKSCWGGYYLRALEAAPPDKRIEYLAAWGGTTTADRSDWVEIVSTGKREGWYRIYYGDVTKMRLKNDKVVTQITAKGKFTEKLDLIADYVIDCTGLIADVTASPFLNDLINRYSLPRNRASGSGPDQRLAGITVSNQFEIKALRNGDGKVYAAGVVTQNGPHAAVDSFLGLQYAALRSADHLGTLNAPGVSRMGPLKSFAQWLRWCAGSPP